MSCTLSNPPITELLFDRVPMLLRPELIVDTDDLVEAARIKGWTVVCEGTEAQARWDMQALVCTLKGERGA